MPAKHLEQRGWEITHFADALPNETLESKGYGAEWYDKRAKEFDFVVSSRTSILHTVEFLTKMRKYNNKPLVMDFDDHFLDVPAYNTAHLFMRPGGGAGKVAKLQLTTSDAATTTTEYAREIYNDYARSITILPNCVDPEDWGPFPSDPQRSKGIRIVFAGNSGRYGDLEECREAVCRIMDEYPTVRIFFMGCFPDWAAKWCSNSLNPKNNRAFSIRWAPFRYWQRVLMWGGFDIALAPLTHNDFNLCKSNLKYLDYGMAGIPGVYSSIDTYSDVKHEDNGMVAHTPEQWYNSLRQLIKNVGLRQHIARTARADVLSKYNIQDRIGLWEKAYESFASLTPNVEAAPWQTQSALQRVDQVKVNLAPAQS